MKRGLSFLFIIFMLLFSSTQICIHGNFEGEDAIDAQTTYAHFPSSRTGPSLVAQWHMDEGTGINVGDSSGNGNHGTLQNMVNSAWVDGVKGKALEFDGETEHVAIADSTSLQLGNDDFTIEAWIKTTAGGDAKRIYINYDDADSYNYFFLDITPDGYARIRIEHTNPAQSSNKVNDGNWHYVAGKREGDNLYIYVDGVEKGSNSGVDNFNAGNMGGSHSIGRQLVGNSYPFNGIIDEVCIYERALSPAEISNHYNNIINGNHIEAGENGGRWYDEFEDETGIESRENISVENRTILLDEDISMQSGCLAHWSFDEGSGDTAHDSSGNEYHGTLQVGNDNVNGKWVAGVRGTALSFDGTDDYVNIPYSDLDLTTSLTFAAWIKTSDTNHHMYLMAIRTVTTGGDRYGMWFRIMDDDNKFWATLGDGGGISSDTLSSATRLTDGNWHHVALTRNGQDWKIYVDGILDASDILHSNNIRYHNSYTHRYIANSYETSYPFNGLMDEICMYNRALTASEIQNLFNHNYGINKYSSGYIRSVNISLPDYTTWYAIECNRTVPENTFLNVTIHDSLTDEVLWEDNNDTGYLASSLAFLDPEAHKKIYLGASFRSNRIHTPVLHNWSVHWVDEILYPPEFIKKIETINLTEDVPVNSVVDLSGHFHDLYSTVTPPIYTLDHVSDTENVTVRIEGSDLSVPFLADNWTGKVMVIVNCTNLFGLWNVSNLFTICVTGVNDAPVWTSLPPSITLFEDSSLMNSYSIFDYLYDGDGDEITVSLEPEDDNINVSLKNTGYLVVTPRTNYFGESLMWVYGTDENGTNTTKIDVGITVEPVNDLPEAVLCYPLNGSIISEDEVVFRWTGTDIESEASELLFDLYLGENPDSLKLHQSDIKSDNVVVPDLRDGYTYFWKVIPYDREEYGICLNGTWNFTINTTGEIPEVLLKNPRGSVNETNVTLEWKLRNTMSTEVEYHVFFSTGAEDLFPVTRTKKMYFTIEGLEEGITYYWTVIPYLGPVKGSCLSGIWNFSIDSEYTATYELDAIADVKVLSITQGDTEGFNISVRNAGNAMMILRPEATGKLANYTTIKGKTEIPVDGVVILSVNVQIPKNLEAGDYVLKVRLNYTHGAEVVEIPVSVLEGKKEGPLPEPPITDEKWYESMGIMTIIIGAFLTIVALAILVMLMIIIRNQRKAGNKEDAPEQKVLESEMELAPRAGITRDEIEQLSLGGSAGHPFQGRLTETHSPRLEYTLPGQQAAYQHRNPAPVAAFAPAHIPNITLPQLKVTGETAEAPRALPMASSVPVSPSEPEPPMATAALPPASLSESQMGTAAALPPASWPETSIVTQGALPVSSYPEAPTLIPPGTPAGSTNPQASFEEIPMVISRPLYTEQTPMVPSTMIDDDLLSSGMNTEFGEEKKPVSGMPVPSSIVAQVFPEMFGELGVGRNKEKNELGLLPPPPDL